MKGKQDEKQASFSRMAEWTEHMFYSLAKEESAQRIRQLAEYHRAAARALDGLEKKVSACRGGKLLNQQTRTLRILCDGFRQMEGDLGGKYKIYLRGCGNAGKSTLLNALLALDEETGSRIGRLPMTFTIDTFTDELPADRAEIRRVGPDGRCRIEPMSRESALRAEEEESEAFKRSKEACDAQIQKQTQGVFLEDEKADITWSVYERKLLRTTIREVRRGIGENTAFQNCVLIDTPGLSQELRFTNVIDDVKEYEIDGIIWVISSEQLFSDATLDSYREEMKTFSRIYSGGKVIAVVNMYGSGPDFQKGGRKWERFRKKAEAFYCGETGRGEVRFDEVVCVNAKLAYEANLTGDRAQMEASNLPALRAKINQMFVERTSEAYHQEKKEKVETFLDNLYRDVGACRDELQQKADARDEQRTKIESLAGACKGRLSEDLETALSRWLPQVRNNINRNLERLQSLQNASNQESSRFLREEIVQTDAFERQIREVVERNLEASYQTFYENRILCVIRSCLSERFALQSFERAAGRFQAEQAVGNLNIRFELDSLRWDNVLSSAYQNGFGLMGKIGGLFSGIKEIFRPLEDRVYEHVESELRYRMRSISIDATLQTYTDQFLRFLDNSMKEECGAYEDICGIIAFEENFLNDREHMTWKEIHFNHLIRTGG